jgi:amidase
MDELLDSPITAISQAIAAQQVKSVDVVRAFLDRIEKVNPALNAVVFSTAEHAMKHAEKADLDVKNGAQLGKMHGVPITIKDSLDTKDAITTWGTMGRADFRPGADATCVKRLREAGAIIMGKTNTPEFTLSFQTNNLVYGKTNNPFDPARTPGGSSGGAAAIIASGASPMDIGTDTGGSIRLPSHFCGIAGIKPTTGRVPCTGNALPSSGLIAPLSQPGPMARYVEDLTLILGVIAGPDNIDPHCIPAHLGDPAAVDMNQLRIAFHTDNGICTPDPAIAASITQVMALLAEHGFTATETRPSGLEMAGFINSRVFSADNGEMVDALLADCRTETPSEVILRNLHGPGTGLDAREFAQVINLWHNYKSSMLSFFDDYDVLICPVNAHTAIQHDAVEDMAAYTYTSAYNLTGWPGAVVRSGQDELGLPIGVQILASPFREDRCLAVASWLEAHLGAFPKPVITV